MASTGSGVSHGWLVCQGGNLNGSPKNWQVEIRTKVSASVTYQLYLSH
jgi:hypothetical protein